MPAADSSSPVNCTRHFIFIVLIALHDVHCHVWVGILCYGLRIGVAGGLMCGSAAACLLAGIAGSNMSVCLSVVSDVLSGRGRCDGPIPRPEESNRVCDQVQQQASTRAVSRQTEARPIQRERNKD